jgi:hypothetical protein
VLTAAWRPNHRRALEPPVLRGELMKIRDPVDTILFAAVAIDYEDIDLAKIDSRQCSRPPPPPLRDRPRFGRRFATPRNERCFRLQDIAVRGLLVHWPARENVQARLGELKRYGLIVVHSAATLRKMLSMVLFRFGVRHRS